MKRIYLTTILLYLFSVLLTAQNASYEWAISAGGTSSDVGLSIVADENENVYTAGVFNGTADFDSGPGVLNLTSAGAQDMFIMKNDVDGNLVWVKQIGGTGADHANGILLDDAGNIYVCGDYSNTADFDPGPGIFELSSNGFKDVFALKLDADGDFVWAKSIGGDSNTDNGTSMTLFEGDLFITGNFTDTVDFDPGVGITNLVSSYNTTSNNFWQDAFIWNLDVNGNFGWAKSMGGENAETAKSITTDQFGNIYTTGIYTDLADFDPGPDVFELSSIPNVFSTFISKLDKTGSFIWAKAYTGNARIESWDLVLDNQQNIYITGGYEDQADFDPGNEDFFLDSNGGPLDVFISKLDEHGDFVWAKSIGSTGQDFGTTITLDTAKNVFIGGLFSGSGTGIDFDPNNSVFNLSSLGPATDCFILKLDSLGNFAFAKAFRGGSGDGLAGLFLDQDHNIYSTGSFSALTDFDPNSGTSNLSPAGVSDIFISKLFQCESNIQIIEQSACDSFAYNGTSYLNSGTYTHVFTNNSICDSVVTIELTINHPSSESISQTACDSIVWFGQTYATSGVYSHTINSGNSGGCDSTIIMDLNIVPSSGSTLSLSDCDSITWGGQTYTSTGEYLVTIPNGNSLGCDSTIMLQLEISTSSTVEDFAEACDSYTWNGETYTTSGTYTYTIVNGNYLGCDSTILLNLNIKSIDNSVIQVDQTLSANESNANYSWVNCPGYVLIEGADGQSFTPLENGSYAVILNSDLCTDTSACFPVTITSLEEQSFSNFTVFPVPFQNEIIIELPNQESVLDVKFYNAVGELVFEQQELNSSVVRMLLPEWADGIYYIAVKGNGFVGRKKLIRQSTE